MTLAFTAIVFFDAWLDGSLSHQLVEKDVQGTGFCILVAILVVLAELELSRLAGRAGAKILLPIAIPGAILVANSTYFIQFHRDLSLYSVYLPVCIFVLLFVYQARRFGTSGAIINCGVSCFSILYLGFLTKFVVDIRLKLGVWELLMFVFVVKSADIGAYTAGRLFGRHKFSPRISPGKTWEGMAGAAGLAAIVGWLFGSVCGIMPWWLAVIFGILFAFIGQSGDLVESMLKRDAEQKDSSNNVPGFGGVLDVVDSVLVAAPFGYLFFVLAVY